MTNIRSITLAALLSGLVAAPAFAEDAAPAPTPEFTITGSAAVTSQYRFRGISQSDNKPAVQAAFTVSHASGFYVSFWGSSASANNAVNIGGTEIDAYAGYAHTFKNGFTVDGGLYGYIYPGSGRAVGISENYWEVYGDVSKAFGPVTAKVGVNWAPKQDYFTDWATSTRYSVYKYGELSLAVPNTALTVHSHLGHTAGGFNYFGNEYFDFSVGAGYKWKALTFDLSVVGTDLKKGETGLGDPWRSAKTMLVGTISASF